MTQKKTATGDFRYNTGPSRIPWNAVGEPVRVQEAKAVIEFLFPQGDAPRGPYQAAMKNVHAGLRRLAGASAHATKLSLGKNVTALEQEAAAMLRVKYACFVTNATMGFEIGYRYANLGPGDEVIAPAITFIATIAYPLAVGAKVVLADVDPATLNMDPADVARKITPRTKVIIPVHLGGYPVDMDPIMRLARKHNLVVIEDAAHAFGGSYKGKRMGAIGHFGAFSFHEVKNITSFGEGGIVATSLPFGKYFARARFLGVDPSIKIKDWLYDVIALPGRDGPFAANNSSSTEIQAVVLRQQMRRLDAVIAKRRAAAQYLNRRLSKISGILTPPLDSRTVRSTHHLYLIQVDPDVLGADVQVFKKKLSDRGVVNIPHFAPLYKFAVMRSLGCDTDAMQAGCPNAERAFTQRFTHLPLYDFTRVQLTYMADAVIESVREMRSGR